MKTTRTSPLFELWEISPAVRWLVRIMLVSTFFMWLTFTIKALAQLGVIHLPEILTR